MLNKILKPVESVVFQRVLCYPNIMNNGLPKRKPNRLKEFDYSTNGAYFITICTQNRKQILSRIIAMQLKSYTTKKYGKQLWQRSYYDHIIRNEDDYLNIWEYVNSNALKWAEDEFYTGDENIG